MLLGLSTVIAPATTIAPASATQVTATASVTAKCAKATKVYTTSVKAYKKALRTGTPSQMTAAKKKMIKAKKAKARACATSTTNASGTSTGSANTSTTRPAAGSGLPGSNAEAVTMDARCPVALSLPTVTKQFVTKSGKPWLFVQVPVNVTLTKKTIVNVVIDAADADGKRFGQYYQRIPVQDEAGNVVGTEQELLTMTDGATGQPLKIADETFTLNAGKNTGSVSGSLPAETNNLDLAKVTVQVQVTCQ